MTIQDLFEALAEQEARPRDSIKIDEFEIDVAITEEHLFESEITAYPLEAGSEATDGIRKRPTKVTIEGMVSNTPIGAMAERRALTEGLPADDARAWLEDIRERGEPVRLETSLRIYDNMAMESLQIPVNAENGDALKFTAVFREIFIITNARTTIRTAVPQHGKKVKKGSKPTTPVNNVVKYRAATSETAAQQSLQPEALTTGVPGPTTESASGLADSNDQLASMFEDEISFPGSPI